MDTAEPAADSLGPRYAPDDPTLPKPWKGLIDGSTGALYYWNPETNVTQYEKPATLPPPFPVGVPPTSSASKPTQLQAVQTVQPNVALAQQGHQITQSVQQPGQPMTHAPQQQGSQFVQTGQQQGSQLGHAPQQVPQHPMNHQFSQHLLQHPGHHMMQQPGHQAPQHQAPQHQAPQHQAPQHQAPQHQAPQHQAPQHQAPQHQGSQLGQPSHQYPQQQPQYMPYQLSMPPAAQQNPHQHQTQNTAQAKPYPNKQELNAGYPKREKDYHRIFAIDLEMAREGDDGNRWRRWR